MGQPCARHTYLLSQDYGLPLITLPWFTSIYIGLPPITFRLPWFTSGYIRFNLGLSQFTYQLPKITFASVHPGLPLWLPSNYMYFGSTFTSAVYAFTPHIQNTTYSVVQYLHPQWRFTYFTSKPTRDLNSAPSIFSGEVPNLQSSKASFIDWNVN